MLELVSFAGRALIFLTAVISADGAWRRRETHRLDILAFVVLTAAVPFR